VPVIGLVQVGAQAMADRYTYVPLIGLFVIVAWGIPELMAKWRHRKVALAVPSVAVLAILLICTRRQVGYWRNSITLFQRAIAATDDNYKAHFNLAACYAKARQIDKAIKHNMEAVRLKPRSAEAHNNLAAQLFKQGKIFDAIDHYKEAARLKPNMANFHNNLGVVLEMQGQLDEAAKCYTEAIRLRPDYANAHYGLASVLSRLGKKDRAMREYREVLRIEPDHVRARQQLERLLKNQSD
jgi:tetratricopeptide (TPR) repeat protein